MASDELDNELRVQQGFSPLRGPTMPDTPDDIDTNCYCPSCRAGRWVPDSSASPTMPDTPDPADAARWDALFDALKGPTMPDTLSREEIDALRGPNLVGPGPCDDIVARLVAHIDTLTVHEHTLECPECLRLAQTAVRLNEQGASDHRV
jgi:hypothetical protein